MSLEGKLDDLQVDKNVSVTADDTSTQNDGTDQATNTDEMGGDQDNDPDDSDTDEWQSDPEPLLGLDRHDSVHDNEEKGSNEPTHSQEECDECFSMRKFLHSQNRLLQFSLDEANKQRSLLQRTNDELTRDKRRLEDQLNDNSQYKDNWDSTPGENTDDNKENECSDPRHRFLSNEIASLKTKLRLLEEDYQAISISQDEELARVLQNQPYESREDEQRNQDIQELRRDNERLIATIHHLQERAQNQVHSGTDQIPHDETRDRYANQADDERWWIDEEGARDDLDDDDDESVAEEKLDEDCKARCDEKDKHQDEEKEKEKDET
ncbi:hypothetical protein P280DRAFT_539929 [Massarina eburnea CBS 473.64]|uniref:Uncharacterized protein n=1 Tax=Massarina eburnea CBS 473.64 TaxID=1395130 RepID=A0A6A6RH27_9PLEO|nr:hypothetical protein P280DRAFT_539929 [Massarina eburnea CBS 473.64]